MDQPDVAVRGCRPDQINRDLLNSDIVVGILPPVAVESQNVKHGWDWVIQYERPLPLLQVKLTGSPHNYISFSFIGISEPILGPPLAALLRSLGVDRVLDLVPDDIRQRGQGRQHWRN